MSAISRLFILLLLHFANPFVCAFSQRRDCVDLQLRYSHRDFEGGSTNTGVVVVHGRCVLQGEVSHNVTTPNYLVRCQIVCSPEANPRILDLFMVAEPSVGRRRLRSDGSWQDPAGMQTILEEMDADLAQMDDTGGAAAAAAATQVDTASSAAAAGAVDGSETPAQPQARRVAQRVATNANDVVIDRSTIAVEARQLPYGARSELETLANEV